MAARAARMRRSSAGRYLDRGPAHFDATASGRDGHLQATRPAHVLALEYEDRGRRIDQPELAQVAAERSRRGAGCRVLDRAARRERVARVEQLVGLAVDELHRRPVAREHELLQAL